MTECAKPATGLLPWICRWMQGLSCETLDRANIGDSVAAVC